MYLFVVSFLIFRLALVNSVHFMVGHLFFFFCLTVPCCDVTRNRLAGFRVKEESLQNENSSLIFVTDTAVLD